MTQEWPGTPVSQPSPSAPAPRSAAPARQPRREPVRPVRFSDDRDAMVRTVIGEAANQGLDGQTAVAAVINNRSRQRGLPASQVVLERNQFEPWGTTESAQGLMAIAPTDPRYIQASAAVDRALSGMDPTGGADHFYAPRAQSALGRPAPSWAEGRQPTVIGDHNFYSLGGSTEDVRQTGAPMVEGGWPGQPVAAPAATPQPQSPLDDLNIHRAQFVDMDAAAALGERASVYRGPGSSADNPFILQNVEPGSEEDYAQRRAAASLSRGMFVQQPGGEVSQLTGDPYTDENAANDQGLGGVMTRERNLGDQARAFTMAAAEQVPFLDEAAVAAAGAISGRGYSDTRDSYRVLQGIDNQTNRGQRIAGGLTGFAGTVAAPGFGAGRYIQGAQGAAGIGRAALVGGASGGVFGAGAADGGLQERAMSGALGAVLGAGTGGVIKGASPLIGEAARRTGSGLSEAGATIARGFGRVAPEAPITARATTDAEQYVQRLVDGSGADLATNPVAARGKPITAAEAIGPSGVSNMAALTRRSGRAGGMAQAQLGARAQEQSNRVVQDFADLTGMDPAGSADMIENLATAGRARARPLYEAAYSMQVQPTPLMENILSRPVGQAALRRAYKIARNEGRNPDELGMFVTTRDAGRPTGGGRVAPDPELFADLDAMRAGRRTQGPARGESLLEFISKNGGVRDDGGELASIGANTWNRQGSWRSRAVRDDGLSLEQMADRARAAGYFSDVVDATTDSTDNYQRLSSQDMIDAIDAELRGNPRFARAVGDTDRSARADLRASRRNALEERLAREGIDISKAGNDDIARALREADDAEARAMAFLEGDTPGEPQIELLPGEVPSMQTLDYVKRGLDDVINSYRDSTTRRLNLDEEGRSVLSAATRFREELVAATGGENGPYAQALAAGGDPIRLEQAFTQSGRLFQVGTPQRAFNTAIERMGEAERNALVAGYADKLFRDAQAGRLSTRQLNQLNVPVTREKLATLLGRDGADSFMQRVTDEVELARTGGRMAPGTNSVTAEAVAAMAEQDQGVGILSDLARNVERSGPVSGGLQTVAQAAYAPIGGFIRGAQAPAPQAVRDEIARLLLLSPEELQAILASARSGSATPESGALSQVLQGQAGAAGGRAAPAFVPRDAQNSTRSNRRVQR
jgi:hypothetical protein